jgi:hypothetical protein
VDQVRENSSRLGPRSKHKQYIPFNHAFNSDLTELMGLSNSSHSFHARTTPAHAPAPSTAPSCLKLQENALFNSVFDNEAFDMSVELPPEVLVSVEREGSITVQLAAKASISDRLLCKSAREAEEEEIAERDQSFSGVSFFTCQDFFEPASSDQEDRESPVHR